MTPYLSPYINFTGECREAMEWYQKILGGKLEMQTFGESPMSPSSAWNDKIMHATLHNDTLSFMACDALPDSKIVVGSNVHLSIAGDDEERLTKIFHALSEKGTVDMPLAKQFWGALFGMVTDQYGLHWMVNITIKS